MKSFREANQVLAKYMPRSGLTKGVYNLDRMTRLMNFLGNPQDQYRVIHVAGTSGKTSTCYYLAALLKSTGHKTGLTVSPYVNQVNERLQINLVPLKESMFCEMLEAFIRKVEEADVQPTYFELLVAFAYWYFAKVRVEYAVVEVGLGGKLDGTNVVNRKDKICVITDVGFDHTDILGETLPEIASQKAGIIFPGNNVFMNKQPGVIEDVIKRIAKEKNANLKILDKPKGHKSLPLFQQRNFVLAEDTVSSMLAQNADAKLTDQNIQSAQRVSIPGRFEITYVDGKTVILDGAHNYQKLSMLYKSVREQYPSKTISTLASMIQKDKKILRESLAEIAKNSDSYVFTTFSGFQDQPKSPLTLQDLQSVFPRQNINFIADQKIALDKVLKGKADIIVITGSIYFLASIRKNLLGNEG